MQPQPANEPVGPVGLSDRVLVLQEPNAEMDALFHQFWDTMRAQMYRNSHRQFRKGWYKETIEQQRISLQISLQELNIALTYGVDVEEKAADVANWALIIWDNFTTNPVMKGLPPSD